MKIEVFMRRFLLHAARAAAEHSIPELNKIMEDLKVRLNGLKLNWTSHPVAGKPITLVMGDPTGKSSGIARISNEDVQKTMFVLRQIGLKFSGSIGYSSKVTTQFDHETDHYRITITQQHQEVSQGTSADMKSPSTYLATLTISQTQQ